MINLSVSITQANITRWQVTGFDINTGRVDIRFLSSNATGSLFILLNCQLSDTAGRSSGPIVNPSPTGWNDKIIIKAPAPSGIGGIGAANSLSNAQAAYANTYAAFSGGATAKHNAGLRAVEGQGLTDGWINSAFNGT